MMLKTFSNEADVAPVVSLSSAAAPFCKKEDSSIQNTNPNTTALFRVIYSQLTFVFFFILKAPPIACGLLSSLVGGPPMRVVIAKALLGLEIDRTRRRPASIVYTFFFITLLLPQ